MKEKEHEDKEWRHFYLSGATRAREKELLKKYAVRDMMELINLMETKTRCYAELLERMDSSAPLSESCAAQFAAEFKWLADLCLGLQECVYGNGLECPSSPARDEEAG